MRRAHITLFNSGGDFVPAVGGGGQVVFNSAGTAQHTTVDSTSFNYTGITVGSGANRALVFAVTFMASVTGVTAVWDQGGTNQAMEFIGSQKQNQWDVWIYWFALVNPTPGNNTLAVNWTTAVAAAFEAADFEGVDQTGGVTSFAGFAGASGATASPGVTITTAVGDIAVAGTTNDLANVTGRSHTLIGDYASAQPVLYTQYSDTGSAAFSWTCSASVKWGAAGFNLVAA